MKGILTFRYDATDWNKSNKYCADKNYSWFSLSSNNPVVNPSIKGNCTWGCTVQASEQHDHKMRIEGVSGFMSDAETWWNHSGISGCWLNEWTEEKTIKPGDILSYEGWYNSSKKSCGGHVRFVYDVRNGQMLIGESGYQGFFYRTKWLPVPKVNEEEKYTSNITLRFKGALRCPENIDKRVSKNKNLDQVTVSIENLRIRETANGTLYPCQYVLPGTYNVLATKAVNDITWCQIDEKAWIGVVDGVELNLPSNSSDSSLEIEHLKNEISTLKATNENLNKELSNAKSTLTKIKEIING